MIIDSLARYYDYLVDNDSEGTVPRRGWSTAKVIGAICLDEEGELIDIISLRQMDGKKILPSSMIVPEQVTRSSGIRPNFLCDGPEYLLGVNTKGKDPAERFQSSKQHHLEILSSQEGIDSPITYALIKFWKEFDPLKENEIIKKQMDLLNENGNFIFQIDGKNAHTDPSVKELWEKYASSCSEAPIMQCLVTGMKLPVARLHPGIKGIRGAQSSGASLVSFNAPAFSSYGNEQSYNAPVSELVTFKYTTALNYLISHRNASQLGDTTIVSWAINGSKGYESLFDALFSIDAKEKINQELLQKIINDLCCGKTVQFDNYEINPETEFCILGISPNAARLSVRFFWKNTFSKLVQNLNNHYKRLEIQKPNYDERELLSVRNLLYETVNKNSKDKAASPILVGGLLGSILNDTRYPNNFDTAVMMRVRAERGITRGQAAILKAFLLKNRSNDKSVKEVCTVSLNAECNYEPYVLGQLFAVLEEIQEVANKDIKSTIKDKYFTSAASMPALIFPRLMQLSQAHLRKIPDEKKGRRINLDKKLTELYGKLPERLSAKLSLREQESFFIGYYHQNQKRYERRNKEEE